MHKLQVDPLQPPIRQKRRKFAPEKDAIINEEVKNLLDAGFIREVQCPEWEVASLYRFYISQQVLSEGSFSSASHRQACRRYVRTPVDDFHGCILRL